MTSGRSMLAPSALTTLISTLCCHVGEDLHMDTINGVKHLFSVIKPFDYASNTTLCLNPCRYVPYVR